MKQRFRTIPIMKQSDVSQHSNHISAYSLGSVGEQRVYGAINDGVRNVQAPSPGRH
jgi:hypothetical protein